MTIQLYRSCLAFGICAIVDPRSEKATELLSILEPRITKCDMPDCSEKAIRVAIYPTESKGDEKSSEFRGLCERHDQSGMYKDNTWSNQ